MSKEPVSRKWQQKPAGPENSVDEDPALQKPIGDGRDLLIVSGPIYKHIYQLIMKEIVEKRKNKNIILSLTTYGGSANEAFKIGKLLLSMYKDVSIYIPSYCKSAGTLITACANSIYMSPFGELGPLDVQLSKKDEIFESKSGLVANFAMKELREETFRLYHYIMLNIKKTGETVTFKLATDIAAKITSEIMKSVYSHVSLEEIGEDAMNLRVAQEYCVRLCKNFGNLKPGAIQRLVHEYPSHDFVIDRDEARELFVRVSSLDTVSFNAFRAYLDEILTPQKAPGFVLMLEREDVDTDKEDADV